MFTSVQKTASEIARHFQNNVTQLKIRNTLNIASSTINNFIKSFQEFGGICGKATSLKVRYLGSQVTLYKKPGLTMSSVMDITVCVQEQFHSS